MFTVYCQWIQSYLGSFDGHTSAWCVTAKMQSQAPVSSSDHQNFHSLEVNNDESHAMTTFRDLETMGNGYRKHIKHLTFHYINKQISFICWSQKTENCMAITACSLPWTAGALQPVQLKHIRIICFTCTCCKTSAITAAQLHHIWAPLHGYNPYQCCPELGVLVLFGYALHYWLFALIKRSILSFSFILHCVESEQLFLCDSGAIMFLIIYHYSSY